MTNTMWKTLSVAAMCGVLTIAGCKVTHDNSNGDKRVSIEAPGASIHVDKNGGEKKVSVETPGASVHVDTSTTASETGIPLYPGAQAKQGSGDDKHRAHVNVDTPFLKVKVVALRFTSEDTPEKVLAYYRKKLENYGPVIECQGGSSQDVELGSGRGFDSPVTCGKKSPMIAGQISLKVGTEGNQHVVAVKPSGSGAEFSLVYVHLGNNKGDPSGGKQPS